MLRLGSFLFCVFLLALAPAAFAQDQPGTFQLPDGTLGEWTQRRSKDSPVFFNDALSFHGRELHWLVIYWPKGVKASGRELSVMVSLRSKTESQPGIPVHRLSHTKYLRGGEASYRFQGMPNPLVKAKPAELRAFVSFSEKLLQYFQKNGCEKPLPKELVDKITAVMNTPIESYLEPVH